MIDVPFADSFTVIAVVIVVVLFVVFLIAFGPFLVALLVAVFELLVIGGAGLVAGWWAWLRRRPHHLVAQDRAGERWVRLAHRDDGSLDLVQLSSGVAPEHLGYERLT